MAIDYKALAEELANFEGAGVFITDIIADPDPVLRKRGDDARIFEDIMSDDQVTQAVMNRKNRVLLDDSFSWYAGDPKGDNPTPEAELLKDRLCEDMERANMTETISGMLDAPYYGFTVIEILWRGAPAWWHIKDLVPRPNHWFRFDQEGRLCFVGERGTAGEPVPEGKFLLVRHHPKYENPYGIRLLSRCLWPVIFKKAGIKFYAEFVEKYGLPFVLGTAAAGAEEADKQKAAEGLSTLRRGGSGVVPYGTSVELLAAGSHHADVHQGYINFWNASISKVLMGQTLTAELSGDTGSYAAAETHKEVSGDIANADRKMVTQGMNELAWIYAQVNNPDAAAPIYSYDTPEDLSARADLDTKLCGMGVEFEQEYIMQTYGISKEHFKMREPRQQQMMPYGGAFAKADIDGPAVMRAAGRLEKIAGGRLDGILKKISEAADAEEAEDMLAEMDLSDAETEEIMRAVLINGCGAGLQGN